MGATKRFFAYETELRRKNMNKSNVEINIYLYIHAHTRTSYHEVLQNGTK